jgi:putative membrane protein
MGFLLHWLVTAIGLYAAAYLVGGVHVSGTAALAVGALVLGFVNAIVRPVLQILSLPVTILTLGFFYFVVNAAAFGLAALLVPGFRVDGFWSAFLGALVVSLVSWLLGSITRRGTAPVVTTAVRR